MLLNSKYYKILPQNSDVLKYKGLIDKALDDMDILINSFKKEYDYAFYYINMLYYTVHIKNVMDKIGKPFTFEEERKKKSLILE